MHVSRRSKAQETDLQSKGNERTKEEIQGKLPGAGVEKNSLQGDSGKERPILIPHFFNWSCHFAGKGEA